MLAKNLLLIARWGTLSINSNAFCKSATFSPSRDEYFTNSCTKPQTEHYFDSTRIRWPHLHAVNNEINVVRKWNTSDAHRLQVAENYFISVSPNRTISRLSSGEDAVDIAALALIYLYEL